MLRTGLALVKGWDGSCLPFSRLKLDGDADCFVDCIASGKRNWMYRDPICCNSSEIDGIQPWVRDAGFLERVEEGQPCRLIDSTVLEQRGICMDEASRTILGPTLRKDN